MEDNIHPINPDPLAKKAQLCRPTFQDYKNDRLLKAKVEAELSALQLSMCCSLMCFQHFTVPLLLFCWAQYLFLPSSKQRKDWLSEQTQKMCKEDKVQLDYAVQTFGRDLLKCCAKGWRVAYGVPEATHKRFLCERNKPNKRRKKACLKSDMFSSPKEMCFVAWLKSFALQLADKMPFGEGGKVQLRLPFPNKLIVWKLYKKFVITEAQKTNPEPPLCYQAAIHIWKHHPLCYLAVLASHTIPSAR
jgi:hypothetical protein